MFGAKQTTSNPRSSVQILPGVPLSPWLVLTILKVRPHDIFLRDVGEVCRPTRYVVDPSRQVADVDEAF